MARFFGCGRVSTDSQEDNTSLDGQNDTICMIAARHGFKNVIRIDDVISGSVPFHQRPNAGKLYVDLRRDDHVGFSKLDRGSRSVIEFLRLKEHFDEIGVILHIGDVDSGNPCSGDNVPASTKVMLTILAAMAEMERDRIKERTTEGRQRLREKLQKQLEGVVSFGRPPFWTEKGRDGYKEKTALVRRMLDLMYEHGDDAIAGTFTREGIPTARGAKEWAAATIKTIFHNPALRGILVLKQRELHPGKLNPEKMVKRHVPRTDFPPIPGYYDRLIEDDEWELLNQIRTGRTKGNASGKTGKFNNLLRGLVECEECGSPGTYLSVVRTVGKHRCPLHTPKGVFPNSYQAADAHDIHYQTARTYANEGKNGFYWGEPSEDLRNRYAYLGCKSAQNAGECEYPRFKYATAEMVVMVVLELVSLHNDWWEKNPQSEKQAKVDGLTRDIMTKEKLIKLAHQDLTDEDGLETIKRLKGELQGMKDRLEILTPSRLAELYAPPRLQYLLDLHKRARVASDDDRPALRREMNDIIRAAVSKVILNKNWRDITVRLQPTFGSCLEFTFDEYGDYVSHGTRDLATNKLSDLKPQLYMAELNRLLNKWGIDDPQWTQEQEAHPV